MSDLYADPDDQSWCRICISKGNRRWFKALDPKAGVTTCKKHGGTGLIKLIERNTITGRYSKALANSPRLREQYEAAREDETLLKVRDDIAWARALYQLALERLEGSLETGPIGPKTVTAHLEMLDKLTKLIEREQKMAHQEQYVASATKLRAMMARMADLVTMVLERYVKGDDLIAAKAEIARGVAMIDIPEGLR